MARCNLTAEERDKILKSKEWGNYTGDEYDSLRDFFTQYLFVEKDDEGTEWHCTSCRQAGFVPKKADRSLYKAKHNSVHQCPNCSVGRVVKNMGRIRSGAQLHQSIAVNFVNVDEAGALYIESGVGFWDYDYDWGMEERFTAKKRYYIAPGKVQAWRRNLNWDIWSNYEKPSPWEPMAAVHDPFQVNWCYGFDGFSVFIGLDKVMRSSLKYCCMQKYFEDYHSIECCYYEKTPLRLVQNYLAEYAMRPVIEMAVKMGHSDIVGELVRDGRANAKDVNWKAKNPAAFCRLTKEEYRALHYGLELEELKLYHQLKKSGKINNPKEALMVMENIGQGKMVGKVMETCERIGVELITAAGYIGKNNKAGGLWVDYIAMAEKLDYDLSEATVVFPKNLQERHDAAAATMESEATERALKAYKKRKDMLEKKYSFCMDGLRIVVPENAAQIIAEGKTLHHCVGGYADRHVEGKTVILFLRRERKPNTPYMTIELDNDGNLRQIHGYKNERYPYAVKPELAYEGWLSTWRSWYKAGSQRDANGRPILKNKENIA